MKKVFIVIILLTSISFFIFSNNFAGTKIDADAFFDFTDCNVFSAASVGVTLYSYNYYKNSPFGSAVEIRFSRTGNVFILHLTTDFIYNLTTKERSQIYLCGGLITSTMFKRNGYYFFLGPNIEVGRRISLTGKFENLALDYGLKSSFLFQLNEGGIPVSRSNFLVPSIYFGISYKY